MSGAVQEGLMLNGFQSTSGIGVDTRCVQMNIFHSLLRIKGNFYPHTETLREHTGHQDYLFSHTGALYSLNTCNGFTKLYDGTEIPSVANRILIFDSSTIHNSSTTTNAAGRFNINFNFL